MPSGRPSAASLAPRRISKRTSIAEQGGWRPSGPRGRDQVRCLLLIACSCSLRCRGTVGVFGVRRPLRPVGRGVLPSHASRVLLLQDDRYRQRTCQATAQVSPTYLPGDSQTSWRAGGVTLLPTEIDNEGNIFRRAACTAKGRRWIGCRPSRPSRRAPVELHSDCNLHGFLWTCRVAFGASGTFQGLLDRARVGFND